MKNSTEDILIFLAVLLVVAVGWVLFHVGRIVMSIIREAQSRKPSRTLQHPELGTLESSYGKLWSGKTQWDGRTVNFTLAGSEEGPAPVLVERLHGVRTKFGELENEAIAQLHLDDEAGQGAFTFENLTFLWKEKPDLFEMEFYQAGDEDGTWRVEFKQGKPTVVGRDD
jgi:hypothetical protein